MISETSIRNTVTNTLRQIGPLRAAVQSTRRNKAKKKRARAFNLYAQAKGTKKLQIGACNHALPGWFNVDLMPFYDGVYYMDATEAFPFPDCSFEKVFSEHMIEHVSYIEAMAMLKECYRILQPKGKIRIATPDLRKLVALYEEPKSPEQKAYIEAVLLKWRSDYGSNQVGVVINNIFGFEHRFIYDTGTLGEILTRAGFRNIVQHDPGESGDADLVNIDRHWNDYIQFETLVMEADKE